MINLISISGGKDSTATALLAIEREVENMRFVFCDTGNESYHTIRYIQYLSNFLESKTGQCIEFLRADDLLSEKLLKKADRLDKEDHRKECLKLVALSNHPAFLKLAVLKGRFPSTMARFCTTELKVNLIKNRIKGILNGGDDVDNWSGVRADESHHRAKLHEREFFFSDEETGAEAWHYRPILQWKADDCFDIMKRFGVEPNPLYKMGFARVGCFPCVNCRKEELRLIAEKFPYVIHQIKEWEEIVSDASLRGKSTFFPITSDRDGILDEVEWSKTSRGGRQYQLDLEETTTCKSVYGLCE